MYFKPSTEADTIIAANDAAFFVSSAETKTEVMWLSVTMFIQGLFLLNDCYNQAMCSTDMPTGHADGHKSMYIYNTIL